MPKPKIFINYRRVLLPDFAPRFHEALQKAFGKGVVFFDREEIRPGSYWDDTLVKALDDAQVLLCLIPPRWVECTHPKHHGRRRIDLPDDWVRKEIKHFIDAGPPKTIIPVLINGGVFPYKKEALPEEIRELTRFQHAKRDVTSANLHHDIQPLIEAIRESLGEPEATGGDATSEEISFTHLLDQDFPDPKPELKKVDMPYVGLRPFKEEEAPIYFGRNREVYTFLSKLVQPDYRLSFFYGLSGVGKSSLLRAGLMPRLRNRFHIIGPSSRDFKLGMDVQLQDALALAKKQKRQKKQEVLLILDQVEEMITFPNPDRKKEMEDFFNSLLGHLQMPEGPRIMLVFRQEYLSDMQEPLQEAPVTIQHLRLKAFGKAGMKEAILGASRIPKFKLTIPEDTVDQIIKQVGAVPGANIAPLLQLQLRSMWDEAVMLHPAGPVFDQTLLLRYEKIKLPEMVEKRLASLPVQWQDHLEHGMIHEILHSLVTKRLTAGAKSIADLMDQYPQVKDFPALQQALVDTYLVLELEEDNKLRLAHDSLGPVVHDLFQESQRTAQRAHRLLESKKEGIKEGEIIFNDPEDVKTLEAGQTWMRRWTEEERTTFTRSKTATEERRKQEEQMLKRNFEYGFKQVEEHILRLEYEQALEAASELAELNHELEQVRRLFQEIAFFYSEIGSVMTPTILKKWASYEPRETIREKIRELNITEGKDKLRAVIKGLDPQHYQEVLWPRYYPDMVYVKGGTFQLGLIKGKKEEKHAPRVTLDDYYIGRTQVTWWQYHIFAILNKIDLQERSPSWGIEGDNPVLNVNWYEAVDYANWLSKQLLGPEEVYYDIKRNDNRTVHPIKTAKGIDCRPKRSGNMQPGVETC